MESQLQTSTSQSYKPNLVNALKQGNKLEIAKILTTFKGENGLLNYEKILLIPLNERLPALAKNNYDEASAVIVVGLTMAFKSMNLSRQMNEDQVLDLADAIIETASEDYLGLEDVMLFLQCLTWGKYGPLYESMDIPKFMEKFEVYRQTRHVEYLKIQDTKHLQYKGLGPSERSTQYDPLSEAAYNMMGRMSELKNKLKEQREINKF